MRIAILTNEYPPYNYGGAGVHVEYLSRELARADQRSHLIRVLCFGDQRIEDANLRVEGIQPDFRIETADARRSKFLDPMLRDLVMAGRLDDVDIVHCHTWYTHLAGCLARQLCHAKLVLTTHSLEPHRPWKVEQLGSAYNASSWVEKTAYQNADGVVAVSSAMRQDVHDLYDVPFERIRVIHNGIDLNQYQPTQDASVLRRYGVDPATPFVLFVGRITRQKGIIHLVNALPDLDPGIQVVLCAGAPDTEEIGREMADSVQRAQTRTSNPIHWIPQMVPRDDIIVLYSHAALFVCPSVYEPFGIINLEAMACGTPVLASAVGGIKEIVVPGHTGQLVPIEHRGAGSFEPRDPDQFARDLAAAINELMSDPARLASMGSRSRERAQRDFSWTSIARYTLDFYRDLLRR